MKQLIQNTPAPNFELVDTTGKIIRISDYRNEKIVVLVLNRGFV